MRTESPWQLANLSPAPSAVWGKLSVFLGWEIVVRTGIGLETGAHMGRVLNDRDTANSRRWACKYCSCGTVPRASSFSRPASEAAAPGGPPVLRQRAVCGKCGDSRWSGLGGRLWRDGRVGRGGRAGRWQGIRAERSCVALARLERVDARQVRARAAPGRRNLPTI
eukprot:scaffold2020_cov107-Isochrysis_galbana.AAC.6